MSVLKDFSKLHQENEKTSKLFPRYNHKVKHIIIGKVKHIYKSNLIPHNVDLLIWYLIIRTMFRTLNQVVAKEKRTSPSALELYKCNYCIIGSTNLKPTYWVNDGRSLQPARSAGGKVDS